jgi:hypothetical protein
MLGLLSVIFTIFAQAPPAKAEPPQNPLMQYLPLAPIPFVFYFMLIRPQQQQEKKRRSMIDNLKVTFTKASIVRVIAEPLE